MANNNNTKNLNVPNLRFPEFKGEWEDKKLGDVATISSGGTPNRSKLEYWEGSIPWVSTSLINFNTIYNTEEKITEKGLQYSSAKIYPKDTILMAMYGQGKTRGKVAILGIDASINQACASIQTNQSILNSLFLFQNLSKRYSEIRGLSNLGGQENLSGAIIKEIKVSYPSLLEQEKIALFFSFIDQRIKTQIKIIEDLKVLQNTLIDYYYHHQRYDKNVSLFDCISQTSERNKKNNAFPVLSVSNKYGFIQQIEQFENRKVASEDISNYKIVRKNDFAYNPARINVGSIAKLIKYSNGIVSPMYICFRAKDNFLPDLLEFYFKSKQFKNEVLKRLEGSVRQCLPFEGLCDIPVVFPPKEKQKDIITQLSAIQTKIEIETTIKELQLKQKQHLLHQMLI